MLGSFLHRDRKNSRKNSVGNEHQFDNALRIVELDVKLVHLKIPTISGWVFRTFFERKTQQVKTQIYFSDLRNF